MDSLDVDDVRRYNRRAKCKTDPMRRDFEVHEKERERMIGRKRPATEPWKMKL